MRTRQFIVTISLAILLSACGKTTQLQKGPDAKKFCTLEFRFGLSVHGTVPAGKQWSDYVSKLQVTAVAPGDSQTQSDTWFTPEGARQDFNIVIPTAYGESRSYVVTVKESKASGAPTLLTKTVFVPMGECHPEGQVIELKLAE